MEFNQDLVQNLIAIVPEILLTLIVLAIIYLDLYLPASRRPVVVGYTAGIGMLLIAGVTLLLPIGGNTLKEQLMWGGMIRSDDLAKIFRVMVISVGGLTAFMGMGDNRLRAKSEFYAIVAIATIGASLLSASADLVMLFVALETLSISLYILSGFLRASETADSAEVDAAQRSSESGLKYFLFGAFTSAFFLYGLTLVYGLSGGKTNIYDIGPALFTDGAAVHPTAAIIVALGLVAVGFGFKISMVPFHFWTPDVYEGAPTPVTSYISVASKAASFAVLTRFMLAVFPPEQLLDGVQGYSDWWVQLFAIIAVITMTLGNVLALVQSNIKRLVAYSSVAQAGYTLVGLVAIASKSSAGDGAASVAYYMFMYAMTNTLLFSGVILFTNATKSENIQDMAGLFHRNPWLTLGITIALLSLAGIPPAAGFVGKFFLFRAAVDAGLTWLAIIGVLNSIVALYYYLIVIKIMYVDRTADDNKPIAITSPYGFVLAVTTIVIILLGTFFISPIWDWASSAGTDLFLKI